MGGWIIFNHVLDSLFLIKILYLFKTNIYQLILLTSYFLNLLLKISILYFEFLIFEQNVNYLLATYIFFRADLIFFINLLIICIEIIINESMFWMSTYSKLLMNHIIIIVLRKIRYLNLMFLYNFHD